MVEVASGLWYDHSASSVMDATITLPVQYGTLLLSALTVMVGFAGASFWNILAFTMHCWRVRRSQALAFELQQQVSLRNTSGSAGALWQAFKMHRAWARRGVPGLTLRTFLFALPAAIVWAGFTVAGLFTSRVANKSYGNTIARVDPSSCGFWQYNSTNARALAAHNAKVINDTVQARTYMTNFYANITNSPTTRSLFVQPSLPYQVDKEARCPIPDVDRCVLGHNGAFSMVTNYLDSHTMLGINARPEDRITVRMNVTCSPIDTTRLFQTLTYGNYTYHAYDFGPIPGASNFTYLYNLLSTGTDATYLIAPRYALAGSDSVWVPSSNFNRTDADVSVYFLSQNILAYMDPVKDPWFLANGTRQKVIDSDTLYYPNNYVNVMICTDQFEFCNPTNSLCTPPAGLNGVEAYAVARNTPGFNPAQRVTAGRIQLALTNSNTYNSVIGLGPGALFANNLVFGTISTGLPDNQWQSEVLGWFQTSLAKLQAYMVEYASNDATNLGPYAKVASPFKSRANNSLDGAEFAALRDQCANQLVQVAGAVQNFSFLGVLIIVCATAFLVLLDLTLESIVDLWYRVIRKGESAAGTARQADGSWHLLRMAVGDPPKDAAGTANAWELGSFKLPVLTQGNAEFTRPLNGNAAQELMSYTLNYPLRTRGAGDTPENDSGHRMQWTGVPQDYQHDT